MLFFKCTVAVFLAQKKQFHSITNVHKKELVVVYECVRVGNSECVRARDSTVASVHSGGRVGLLVRCFDAPVLTHSATQSVRLYDVATNKGASVTYEHKAAVLDACFVGDGSAVVSGGLDKALKRVDLATGESIGPLHVALLTLGDAAARNLRHGTRARQARQGDPQRAVQQRPPVDY